MAAEGRKPTNSEFDALAALDFATYEDAENGGDGWVGIATVADLMGVSYFWAAQLLRVCRLCGWAESVGTGRVAPKVQYALSEQGVALLREEDTPHA